MASRSLGSLTLDLILKIGGFTAGMDKAARETDKRMKSIQRSVSSGVTSVVKGLAGLAAGFLSVQAVFQGFNNAIDQADKLNDFTKRLGVSAEAISAWGYAASQTGTDIDSLGKGLRILQKNMAEALDPKSEQGNLFKALGIDVKDAQGNLRDLEGLLPEIANAFKTLDNDATETALAMQLFGKSGADLLEFLNQGGDGLDEFTKKAHELGIVLSQETLSAADDFNDGIGNLKAATQGAIYQALEPMLPVLQSLVEEMVKFAKTGGGAKQAGEAAATGISAMMEAAQGAYTLITKLQTALSGYAETASGILKFLPANIFTAINALRIVNKELGSQATSPAAIASQGIDFTKPAPTDPNTNALQDRVNKFLQNPTGRTGSSKKAGKSDAEKEAESLQRAYESMNERLKEQVALFGETTEAAKLRYELENGELSKLTQLQKDELLARAENLDAMKLQAELQDAADKRVLDEVKAFEDRRKQFQDQLSDMEFENQLITMNNRDRQVAIEQRYAGVEAMSEEGRQIAQLVDANIMLAESYGFVNEAKDILADSFADFITGAKSAKEAFGDFADSIYRMAVQLLADKAVNALFDMFKNTGASATGSTGTGGWAALFSSFLGSGRAWGGNVGSGMIYPVNERGPELLTVGGKDFLMMGSQSGRVTANERMSSSGSSTVINVAIAPTHTRRTAQQSAMAMSRAQRTADLRNK